MVNAVNTISALFPDLDQQITELDVSLYNAGDNTSNFAPTVPPLLIAEQGWLYKQYFDALRNLSGKISSVTFWGFADDDTWLDSFPINRLDLPLPFDTGLQAKPAFWGMIDPSQLPGAGLTFAVSSTTDIGDGRVYTLTATNGGPGTAYAVQLAGFSIQAVADDHCRTLVVSPTAFPIALGDLPTGSSASVSFTVRFFGCGDADDFTFSTPWTSATYDNGTFTSVVHYLKDTTQ